MQFIYSPVDDASNPLIMVVMEKDEVLGQVIVPLDSLTKDKERKPIRCILQPHKKCPKPQGELTYSAWPINFREGPPVISKSKESSGLKSSDISSAFSKVKSKISRRSKQSLGSNPSLSGSNKMLSVSCYDLAGLPESDGVDGKISDADSNSSFSVSAISGSVLESDSSFSRLKLSKSTIDLSDSKLPEISGISPKEGSAAGGTRLTIRGTNLGLHKEDIVGLFVCGSNVLGSLEFESSRKIYCTTKTYKPCVGKIVVETQSGGRGTSLVDFTFLDPHPTKQSLSRQSSGTSTGTYDMSNMERGEAEGMRTIEVSTSETHNNHGHRKVCCSSYHDYQKVSYSSD